ncbi:hypothetical protein PLESTB_000360600 [Pleodorina starrii]|uniref:GATA-type domain-containing protein n=1 Tax=Pleodorina starrii TaxID=330485 RepID=A0A9W6EZM2_9CHLO|nr:hypothetical protein PLESTM_000034600 [Pleodorina starrii]GLC50266.1 hypothetical protein PLESTB_000360600 [Pleodorina starrii]GLC64350.1 hypothetical protein PLESTF_000152000 [Pleodorina starrii]
MRGNKRRAAALVTAANKTQPALNDAVLDLANRKGMRCCVECGATSTPQWREGPKGPKTLCNACGVRRQRLLRKQQAATVGSIPTAPVAAVQARRRTASRVALQAPTMESDELPFGVTSGSEHSSDETEVDWATAMPVKQQQQGQRQQQLLQHEVEESCNEDESAAYDLLYFAGVQRSAGGLSGVGSDCPLDHHRQTQQHQQHHGHNTRRHVQPVHRSDDFYYFYEEEEAPGLESGETEDGSGPKRRKVTTAPPHLVGPWMAGSSFSSSEDAPENELLASQRVKASDNSASLLQQQHHGSVEEPQVGGNALALLQTVPAFLGSAPIPSAPAPATTMPSASASTAASSSPLYALPVPVALPVLPLSLPSLPAVSAKDYEVLLKLQLDFQRACLQLHQANVQCEAVSAVVAEHRQAATSAHEQAAAASQQLAEEARAVADRYRLRDVLSDLRPAAAAAAPVGRVAARSEAIIKQEQQQ